MKNNFLKIKMKYSLEQIWEMKNNDLEMLEKSLCVSSNLNYH
jgi:hypothetical protein